MQTRSITLPAWPSLARSPVQPYRSIFGRITWARRWGRQPTSWLSSTLGPLFILGLVFLAGYSIIFVVAAAIVVLLRKRRTSESTDDSA